MRPVMTISFPCYMSSYRISRVFLRPHPVVPRAEPDAPQWTQEIGTWHLPDLLQLVQRPRQSWPGRHSTGNGMLTARHRLRAGAQSNMHGVIQQRRIAQIHWWSHDWLYVRLCILSLWLLHYSNTLFSLCSVWIYRFWKMTFSETLSDTIWLHCGNPGRMAGKQPNKTYCRGT